jgi:hypothetical protein
MASSDNGISWNGWTESLFGGSSILCAAYGGGCFVAGGDGGKMIYMKDGGAWTPVGDSRFGSMSILALAWGNPDGTGTFVAAGQNGQLSWSTDGINWNYENSAFGGSAIYGLAWGNKVFVAVGDGGKITWSADGKNWQSPGVSPFGSSGILGIAFGSGTFVAAGHDGKMAKSADGKAWTVISASEHGFGSGEQLQAVSYGGGKFLVAAQPYAEGGSGRIICGYQKPPPSALTDKDSAAFNSSAGDNQLVITLTQGKFAPSAAPSHFTVKTDGTAGFSPGALIGSIVDRGDTRLTIKLSSPATAAGSSQVLKVSAAAFTEQPLAISVRAEKALVWKTAAWNPFGSSGINAIAHNGVSQFVAVGAATIAVSADGVSWTEIIAGKINWANGGDYVHFQDIAYGNGKFIAVGYWVNGGTAEADGSKPGWGVAAVSGDNGVSWTVSDEILTFSPAESGSISPRVYGIAHNGGSGASSRFIAVGRWGRSAYSDDNGANWTAVQIAPFNYTDNPSYYEDALAVRFGVDSSGTPRNIFLVGGRNGKLAFLEDNAPATFPNPSWKWAADNLLGPSVDINTLCFGNGVFIAAGNSGNMKVVPAAELGEGIAGTSGGHNWEGVDSKFGGTGIFAVAHNGASGNSSRFVAAGHNGKMSVSPNGRDWTAIAPGSGDTQTRFDDREQISALGYGNGRFIAGGNAYAGNASKLTYSE